MTLTIEQWASREATRVAWEQMTSPFADILWLRDDEPDESGPPTLQDAEWFERLFQEDMTEREHTS